MIDYKALAVELQAENDLLRKKACSWQFAYDLLLGTEDVRLEMARRAHAETLRELRAVAEELESAKVMLRGCRRPGTAVNVTMQVVDELDGINAILVKAANAAGVMPAKLPARIEELRNLKIEAHRRETDAADRCEALEADVKRLHQEKQAMTTWTKWDPNKRPAEGAYLLAVPLVDGDMPDEWVMPVWFSPCMGWIRDPSDGTRVAVRLGQRYCPCPLPPFE